jgi:hypothetical protein
MRIKKYRNELLAGFILLTVVVITVLYGALLEQDGINVRRWNWSNLLLVFPLIPLLFLQQKASLPAIKTINEKKNRWLSPLVWVCCLECWMY